MKSDDSLKHIIVAEIRIKLCKNFYGKLRTYNTYYAHTQKKGMEN